MENNPLNNFNSNQAKKIMRITNYLKNSFSTGIILILLIFMTSLENRVYAQDKISGKVTDNENGQALPGVNVFVKGTTNGTVTDFDGGFTLEARSNSVTLVFSYLGYLTQEVKLSGDATVDVSLKPDLLSLDEVVVVGYGTQKRSDLTGSVASVKGEDLTNVPARNLAEALQGRVAGIQVTQNGGRPGQGADIIIRGASSTQGAPPLYIVDGIRIGTGNNFNIQDIESIEVMKDASAAAIYGSQAAGGVVLITTKKGANQKGININFNARSGIRNAIGLYDLLDSQDYITAKAGIGELIEDNGVNTDWTGALFETGLETNYNFSISGGNEEAKYFMSANYQNEEGIRVNNEFERFSFRVNTEFDLGRRIKIGENLMAWKTDDNPPANSGGFSGEPFRSTPLMRILNPSDPAAAGGWAKHPAGVNFAGGNPVAQEFITHQDDDTYGLEGNIFANVNILDGLDLRGNLGIQLASREIFRFQQEADFNGTAQPQELRKEFSSRQQYTTNLVLTYDKDFKKHSLKTMIGAESVATFESFIRGIASEFPVTVTESFELSESTTPILQGTPVDDRLESYFGRLNYSYDDKYLLQATIRRDGSSKFGPRNAWGNFPSVSVGWKISEEKFMADSFFNNLRLRASYGILGNDNIGRFRFLPAIENINVHSFDNSGEARGFANVKFPNEGIKWEKIATSNVGIEGSILNNALSFSAEYYNKRTTDMLYETDIPLTSGLGGHNGNPQRVAINLGEVINEGFEFVLNYSKTFGDFRYSVGGNLAFNRNEVVSLGTDNIPINQGGGGFALEGTITRTEAGQPISSFFGYDVIGIFESDAEVEALNSSSPTGIYQENGTGPGDLIYADTNGDQVITPDDRVILGSPWPDAFYGINLSVKYKNFDLSMLFSGVAGVELFNSNKAYTQNIYGDYNTTGEIFNASFFNGNGLTNQPRVFDAAAGVRDPNGNFRKASAYFVEDGSYLELQNLQMGYNLPSQIFSEKITGRLYLTAQNLFTITGYSGRDPELAGDITRRGIDFFGSYPNTRLVSIGIEIGF